MIILIYGCIFTSVAPADIEDPFARIRWRTAKMCAVGFVKLRLVRKAPLLSDFRDGHCGAIHT